MKVWLQAIRIRLLPLLGEVLQNAKIMKLTKEMIERIEKWVELNGLYPQPCGATIQALCRECGFSDETFRRWSANVAFVDMLSRAREKFAATTEITLVNALVRAAAGVDYTREKQEATAQKVVEFDPKTGKKVKEYTTETLVPKKATRENIYFPPNVEAAKFVLSNLAPERWRLKQEVTHQGGGEPLTLTLTDPQARAGLTKALETGAKPR